MTVTSEKEISELSRGEKAQLLQWLIKDLGDDFAGIESRKKCLSSAAGLKGLYKSLTKVAAIEFKDDDKAAAKIAATTKPERPLGICFVIKSGNVSQHFTDALPKVFHAARVDLVCLNR